MRTTNKLVMLLLIIINLVNSACTNSDNNLEPTTPTEIATAADLSTYLETIINDKEIPGFAVSIALNDAIAYQKSFGFANIAAQTPYTNQTVNSIASISKTFVSAAAVKAIEQGYFTLETNINDLLPIEVYNPKHPLENIKVKHLLTHTSGIIDNPQQYFAANYFIFLGENTSTNGASFLMNDLGIEQHTQVALEDYLVEIFLEDGDLYSEDNYLDAKPGTQWAYSNTATALMSYIIEYVSDAPFYEYVANNVLLPLQMSNSTFNFTEINTSNLATLYLNEYLPLPRYGNHSYAEGSMHTTNEDFSKYLLDMMKGIKGESSVLFTPASYNLLFSNLVDGSIVPGEFAENQAIYWYENDGYVMHGGNSFGTSSQLQIEKNGTSGFYILTNMDGTTYETSPKWEEVKLLISTAIEQYITHNK